MSLRLARAVAGRIAGAALLTSAAVGFAAVVDEGVAAADPSAPPPYSSLQGACPGPEYPPKDPQYGVPFRAIIFNGQITIPPNIVIPHLFATACGLVTLPSLSGSITGSNIKVAAPNVYIAGLEALPVDVSFGQLSATISLTPAHNGGLDVTVNGTTTASVSTLGMTCSITLDAKFTTLTDGALTGQPVTGPTTEGQAVTVSNSFAVPGVVGSDSSRCPPSVAGAFNQALHLPAPAGTGKFTAPFCFDFELMNTDAPKPTANCPWPTA